MQEDLPDDVFDMIIAHAVWGDKRTQRCLMLVNHRVRRMVSALIDDIEVVSEDRFRPDAELPWTAYWPRLASPCALHVDLRQRGHLRLPWMLLAPGATEILSKISRITIGGDTLFDAFDIACMATACPQLRTLELGWYMLDPGEHRAACVVGSGVLQPLSKHRSLKELILTLGDDGYEALLTPPDTSSPEQAILPESVSDVRLCYWDCRKDIWEILAFARSLLRCRLDALTELRVGTSPPVISTIDIFEGIRGASRLEVLEWFLEPMHLSRRVWLDYDQIHLRLLGRDRVASLLTCHGLREIHLPADLDGCAAAELLELPNLQYLKARSILSGLPRVVRRGSPIDRIVLSDQLIVQPDLAVLFNVSSVVDRIYLTEYIQLC